MSDPEPLSPRLPPRRHWIYPSLLALTIIVESSCSRVAEPHVVHVDKYAHFLVYGLLGTLVARQWRKSLWPWAVVAASLFGVSDEIHQLFTPGRSAEVADWIADTLGALLAVTLYTYWPLYHRVLEWKLGPKRIREAVSKRGNL